MENIELFDDDSLVDVTDVFKVSDKEKEQREVDSQKKDNKQPLPNNKVEIKLPEEKVEEEIDEEPVNNQEPQEEEEDLTDEEKEIIDQVSSLRNMGALFLPDDYEVESIEKAIEDSDKYRQNLALNTIFNKIPDTDIPGVGNAKDLFVYIYEHGGTDINKFKETFGNESFNPNNFDLQKEEDRRKVLELYYSKKGFSDTKTKKFVDKIFDDFEDESEATEALGELVKIDQQSKQEHLQELAKKKEENKQLAEEAYNYQVSLLENKDTIGGYPIGKTEKTKALNSLYSLVNVGGKEMSDFDYRLNSVVLNNPELTLALSAFLNTLSQDQKGNVFFDLSKFERKEKTKAVKSLKEEVARVVSGKRKFSSTDETYRNPKDKGFSWDRVADYSDLI